MEESSIVSKTAKSVYQQEFDNRVKEAKAINDTNSKDLRDKEKNREYSYPPLPNLVTAKKAYINKKQNNSIIVDKTDNELLDKDLLNISAPDIEIDHSFIVESPGRELSPIKVDNT